jgi:hypothetical protein
MKKEFNLQEHKTKALNIADVSQQRELLKAFCEWAFKEDSDWHQVNRHIEGYLDSL